MIDELLLQHQARERPLRVGVWNYYEEITRDGFLFKNARVSIGANLLQPWVDLYQFGQAHGIQFFTLDQIAGPDDLDAVIFIDRPRPGRPLIDALMSSPVLKYLVIYECEVIKPDNWERSYHEQFDRVFTWNDNLVDGGRYLKINFATDLTPAFDFEALKSDFANRKLATVIAGAKVSAHPNELYSERVRAIRWYETNAPEDFDLYGVGWDTTQFPSYRGRVDDKLATLARYRFSICYENAKRIPGYITEKILDCLRTGTVPVYGGAPNIEQWIAPDCFVDLRKFSSYPELHEHLRSMDAATHGGYLDRIRDFLSSPKAEPFSSKAFVATLAKSLLRDSLAREQRPDVQPQFEASRFSHAAVTSPVQPVAATAALDPDEIRRNSLNQAGGPRLVVMFGYGDELPVFKRARALWEFFLSHYPQVHAVFARTSSELPHGEVKEDGNDLIVGIGLPPGATQDAGYASTGVWSANENRTVIFRQMAAYKHLLRTHPGPFHLYQTTVTSVIDFRGLTALLEQMPTSACYAGWPARLNSPPEVAGLTFISGANCLFSRDVLELMLQRYDPAHHYTGFPNDVWQALVLQDLPRLPLPFVSFTQPRSIASRSQKVPALAARLLAGGHYHFRIKTTSAEDGMGLREEVDPWVMVGVMDAILNSGPVPESNRALVRQLRYSLRLDAGQGVPAISATPLYTGARQFPLTDAEAEMIHPDLAG